MTSKRSSSQIYAHRCLKRKISREKFAGPQTIASSSKYQFVQVYPILTSGRWKREFCRGGCTTSRLSGRETSAFDTNNTNRTRGGQKTRSPLQNRRRRKWLLSFRTDALSLLLQVQKQTAAACLSPALCRTGSREDHAVFLLLCARRASETHCSQPPLGTHARSQRLLAAGFHRITQITTTTRCSSFGGIGAQFS